MLIVISILLIFAFIFLSSNKINCKTLSTNTMILSSKLRRSSEYYPLYVELRNKIHREKYNHNVNRYKKHKIIHKRFTDENLIFYNDINDLDVLPNVNITNNKTLYQHNIFDNDPNIPFAHIRHEKDPVLTRTQTRAIITVIIVIGVFIIVITIFKLKNFCREQEPKSVEIPQRTSVYSDTSSRHNSVGYYIRKYSHPSIRIDDQLNCSSLITPPSIIPSTVKTTLKPSLTSYATSTTASSSIICDTAIVLSSMRQKDLELDDVFHESTNHLFLETKSLTPSPSSTVIKKHLSVSSKLSKNNNITETTTTTTTTAQADSKFIANNNTSQQKSCIIIENNNFDRENGNPTTSIVKSYPRHSVGPCNGNSLQQSNVATKFTILNDDKSTRKYSLNSVVPQIETTKLIGHNRRRISLSSAIRRNSFAKHPAIFCETIDSDTPKQTLSEDILENKPDSPILTDSSTTNFTYSDDQHYVSEKSSLINLKQPNKNRKKNRSSFPRNFMQKIERFRFIDDSASSTTTVTSPVEGIDRTNQQQINNSYSNNLISNTIEQFDDYVRSHYYNNKNNNENNSDDYNDQSNRSNIECYIDRINSKNFINGYSDMNILENSNKIASRSNSQTNDKQLSNSIGRPYTLNNGTTQNSLTKPHLSMPIKESFQIHTKSNTNNNTNNTDNAQIIPFTSTMLGKSSAAIPIPRSATLFNHNIKRPNEPIHQCYPSDSTIPSSFTKNPTNNKYSYPTNGPFISQVLSRSMDFSKKYDMKNDFFNNNCHTVIKTTTPTNITNNTTPLTESSSSLHSSTSLEFYDDMKPSGVVVDDDFLPMSSPVDDDYWDNVSVETTIQCFPNVGSSPVIEVKHFETNLLTGDKIHNNHSITTNNSRRPYIKDSDDQYSETSEDYLDDDDDDLGEENINNYSVKEFALKELQKPIVLKSALKSNTQLGKMTELSSSDEFKMRPLQTSNNHLGINSDILERISTTNVQSASHSKLNNNVQQHHQCSPLNRDYSLQMSITKNYFMNKEKLNQEQIMTNDSSLPSSPAITNEPDHLNISVDLTTDLNERLRSYLPQQKHHISDEITTDDQIHSTDNEKLLKNISSNLNNTSTTTRLKVSSPPCPLYTSSRQSDFLNESSTVHPPQTIYEEGEDELQQRETDSDDGDESPDDGEIDLMHEYELSQRLNGGLDDVQSSSITWNTDDKLLTTDDMNKYYLMQKDDLLSIVTSSPSHSTVRSSSSDFISHTKPIPPSIMKTSKSIEQRDTLLSSEQTSLPNIISSNSSSSALLQSPAISTVIKPKVRFNLDPEYEREREWNKVNKLLGNVEWTDEFEV